MIRLAKYPMIRWVRSAFVPLTGTPGSEEHSLCSSWLDRIPNTRLGLMPEEITRPFSSSLVPEVGRFFLASTSFN